MHITQSLEWAQVRNESDKKNEFAYSYILDENEIIVCFALIRVQKISFTSKSHGSIPCGPVFNNVALFQKIFPQFISLLKKHNFISIDLNPFWFNRDAAIIEQIIVDNSGRCIHKPQDYHFSSVYIDITKSEKEIFSSFKKTSTQQMIKKAQRIEGITIRKGTENDALLFTEMYNAMMGSKMVNSKIHTIFFNTIYHTIIIKEKGYFLVQEYRGEPLAMAMCFICGEGAIYSYGASSPEHKVIPKGHLLQWELIKLAKARNLKYYDMGGIALEIIKESNPILWGINQFKLGFSRDVVINCKKHLVVLDKKIFYIKKSIKGIMSFFKP